MRRRTLLCFLCSSIASIASLAQDLAPPSPQRLVVHSNVLNEDRVIWVRMPDASRGKKESYPVLYMTDGGTNVNEIGSTIDFLADNNFIPPLIVVGITNTDRNRDLTPSHAGVKHFGGLFAIHALIARPDLFNACIASSPSLWWDDARTVREAQEFLARGDPQLDRTADALCRPASNLRRLAGAPRPEDRPSHRWS